MTYRKLNPEDHVARKVSKQRWGIVNGKPTAFQQAFKLRTKEQMPDSEDETSLSCSWNEHFQGSLKDQTKSCLKAMKNGGLVVKPNNAIAVCNVGKLEVCGKNHNLSIRAMHKKKPKNPAYASIDGMRIENQSSELLNEITSTAVVECFKVIDL